MTLKTIVSLARSSSYNEEVKASFHLAALAYLRKLARELALERKSFDVRFNAGGIAVSGEATLHHESFYLQISESGCMFRTCKGRKDYTGGPNQWAEGCGSSITDRQLAERLVVLLDNVPTN